MTTPKLVERCQFQVSEPPHYLHAHRCSRAAKDGGYCTQHAKIVVRRSTGRPS